MTPGAQCMQYPLIVAKMKEDLSASLTSAVHNQVEKSSRASMWASQG